jgi:hypothetical protein
MTLLALEQAPPADHDDGSLAAIIAPSRAALVTVIFA